MRRLTALVVAATACAQPGTPPGGPPDVHAPRLVRVRPDSSATNVRSGSITFEFDEVVSERPQGAPSLADVFVVSPSTGTPRVAWHRSTVVLTPRGGLQPNTTYTIELRPGIVDLSNNVDSAGRIVVFSTGSTIADGYIAGRVFDWVAAKPAARAYIEAVRLPDSARYETAADSLGAFRLANLPAARYLVRTVIDQNHNRLIDPREPFDSFTVSLTDSLRREFLAALRDSLGPGIASVDARDSVSLRVTFDRPLDTALVVTPANFVVKTSDSTELAIRAVLTGGAIARRAADSLRQQRVQDSVRAAARADSIRAADSARAGVPPPIATGRRPGAVNAPPLVPPPDTMRPAAPRPSVAIPDLELWVELQRPWPADATIRIRARDMRGITGITRSTDRVFTTPRPRAKPDTSSTRGSRRRSRND